MKKHIILFFLIVSIFCCNENDHDINGHWHLFRYGLESESYLTLDINDSISPILEKQSLLGPVYGVIDKTSRELIFFGESGILYCEYSFSGDTLKLKNNLNDRYAIKYTDSVCSYKNHLIKDFRVKVDFPLSNYCHDSLDFFRGSNFHDIFIGEPSYAFVNSYHPGVRMAIGGKFANEEEIPLWVNELKNKQSFERLQKQCFRIISDKDVQVEKIMSIVEKLTESGINNVYLMIEKRVDTESIFQYLRINDIKFIENLKTVNDLVNCI